MTKHDDDESIDHNGVSLFTPRLYIQRYNKVLQILSEVKPKKVVDLGCAECKFIQLLKREEYIEKISGVDIDENILEISSWRIDPLTIDYICPRSHPLTINLFQGSVLETDKNMKYYDAVTCIEMIEHLELDDLQKFNDNVFGFIQPNLAVITTPNADFNVNFSMLNKFRHWDHKFEWTQEEFKNWCDKICLMYNYSVKFDGVGKISHGSDGDGYCSQIAIFSKTNVTDVMHHNCPESDFSYKTISSKVFPCKNDECNIRKSITTNVKSFIDVIISACKSALSDENDDSQFIALASLRRNHHNSSACQISCPSFTGSCFKKTNFITEEEQFLGFEDCEDHPSRNIYGQERFNVIAVPNSSESSILEHFKVIYKSSHQTFPVVDQFRDIETTHSTSFSKLGNKQNLKLNCFFTHLCVYDERLQFYLQTTEDDVRDENTKLDYDVIYANLGSYSLRIPVLYLLRCHEIKSLNVDSTKVKEVLKENIFGFKLTKDDRWVIVDMLYEECDSDCDSYSDQSSLDSSFENNFVGSVRINETFYEKSWDSD